MPAKRVTIPTKKRLDPLYHDEVNALRDAANDHADLLDAISASTDVVNVPLLDPAHNYPPGFVVRAVYGGISYPLVSRNGGAHPAPPDPSGDNNWGPVAPATPPTALSQLYDLSYAQYVLARFPESIKPGLLYLMRGNWNSSPAPDTVEVEGGQGGFAALGTLVSAGTRQAVTVDVAAGTYSTALGGGGGTGTVQTVNGVAPDAQGNVLLAVRDRYDVPAAKRVAVADAIVNQVAQGGPAMLQETDEQYAGTVFKDGRDSANLYRYCCDKEANLYSGATEYWWNRTRIR